MKTAWSRSWISSKQPRKQRKYRYNAPAHIRHKFLSANLSKELRQKFGLRSIPLRKGDEVQVMRGGFKGTKGLIEEVDSKKLKVYIAGIKVKKVDGSEVAKSVDASNLKITSLKLDDKRRQEVIARAKKGKVPTEAPKTTAKPSIEKV
ncbi:MAG TPA: 50S ribosomal protein L24 [archaeon]|nr:50S ribosomal protein L24 [archaeon]